MYCDFVLMDKDNEIEKFSQKLGFSKLIFKEDFNKYKLYEYKDYENARKLVESKKVKILVNPHVNIYRDTLHFRSGGLDPVLCNLAHKNEIMIGFSLDTVSNAVMLGRLRQNVMLCRKYKVKIQFFTFAKNPYELNFQTGSQTEMRW